MFCQFFVLFFFATVNQIDYQNVKHVLLRVPAGSKSENNKINREKNDLSSGFILEKQSKHDVVTFRVAGHRYYMCLFVVQNIAGQETTRSSSE